MCVHLDLAKSGADSIPSHSLIDLASAFVLTCSPGRAGTQLQAKSESECESPVGR